MSNIEPMRDALVARILHGRGDASEQERRAAFANAGLAGPLRALIDKVVRHAQTVTASDVRETIRAGVTEDRLFELVVCAAIGEASRQHEGALAALDAAKEER